MPFRNAILVISYLFLLGFSLGSQALASTFYGVDFSKKNQIKTGLIWIKFKSSLIEGNYFGDLSQEIGADSIEVSGRMVDMGPPFSTIGRLFFTMDGNVASCTGFFSGASQVVMIPADCVMSPEGEWYGNFLFIQSYGTKRKEIFAVNCIGVYSDWAESGATKPSYAAMKVDRLSKRGGLSLTQANPPDDLIVLGYPNSYKKKYRMLATKVVTQGDSLFETTDKDFDNGSPWAAGSTVYAISHSKALGQSSGKSIDPSVITLSSFASNDCRGS